MHTHNNENYCHHFHSFTGFRKDKKFALPGATKQYPPSLDFRANHYFLDLNVDLAEKKINGFVTITLEPVHGKSSLLILAAIELEIEKVFFQNQETPFHYTGETIEIPLTKSPTNTFEIKIKYSATPRKGLYFIEPDVDHEGQGLQVWSQGQDVDSKWWFPCLDYPNQKATTEFKGTVAEKYFCVGNGKLINTISNEDGTKTYHWKQAIPHVNYLITLAAGEFACVEESWNGIPLQYYVPKNAQEKALRVFGKTADMMDYFSKKIGVPYPFEKYAQVVVQNFIFGGMENTTATTLSDRIMVDERAEKDYDYLSLLAHELAHQWWGNLVTCRGWTHAWLNEGFATFFEVVYFEHLKGQQEADYYAYGLRDDYYSEEEHYTRSLVEAEFFDCGELFDRHIYHKGALVLRMLRDYLGEDLWWKGIKAYVEKHQQGFAETDNLKMILEETSGKQLGPFFDDWVYGKGHPSITAKYTYNSQSKLLQLIITQNQKHQLFRFPLKVDIVVNGEVQNHVLECEHQEQRFFFPADQNPDRVVINRQGILLSELTLDFPEPALINQLKVESDVMARVFAAEQLGKKASPQGIEALKIALLEDPFWGVQAACAGALGKLHCDSALKALLMGLETKDPKARLAVVQAIGNYQSKEAFQSLLPLLEKDESYFVEAEAALSIGKTRQAEGLEVLMTAMKKKAPTFNYVFQINILNGLAALKNEKAFEFIKEYLKPSHSIKIQMAALGALTQMFQHFKEKRDMELYQNLASNAGFHLRYKIADCLQKLSDPKSLGFLQQLKDDLDGRVRRIARETIHTISESEAGQNSAKLAEELEKLRAENKEIQARLAELEANNSSKQA